MIRNKANRHKNPRRNNRPRPTSSNHRPPTLSKKYDESKLALLIGVEYVNYDRRGQAERLPGCHVDVANMYTILTQNYLYNPQKIYYLADIPGKIEPNMRNIKHYLQHVINQAQDPHIKHITLAYSGHGLQIRDTNGDEPDGQDEAIVPSDYLTAGFLTDDYFCQHFLQKIPTHVEKVTCIMDCCNSGTVFDLSYTFNGTAWVLSERINPETFPTQIISLSGCRDHQTSASAFNLERKRKWQGAMSVYLRSVLKNHKYQVTLSTLIKELHQKLAQEHFAQRPVLACSREISLNTPIHLF